MHRFTEIRNQAAAYLRNRKGTKAAPSAAHEEFRIEPLEPRVLLSGEAFAEAVALPLAAEQAPLVLILETEQTDTPEAPGLPTIFEFAVVETDQEAGSENAVAESELETSEGPLATNGESHQSGTNDGHDSIASQLTESLRVAHGPPGSDSEQV